jgi:hypothetical protein
MSDVILVATILVFFVLGALLVRACARITDGSLDDPGFEDLDIEQPGPKATE